MSGYEPGDFDHVEIYSYVTLWNIANEATGLTNKEDWDASPIGINGM